MSQEEVSHWRYQEVGKRALIMTRRVGKKGTNNDAGSRQKGTNNDAGSTFSKQKRVSGKMLCKDTQELVDDHGVDRWSVLWIS